MLNTWNVLGLYWPANVYDEVVPNGSVQSVVQLVLSTAMATHANTEVVVIVDNAVNLCNYPAKKTHSLVWEYFDLTGALVSKKRARLSP